MCNVYIRFESGTREDARSTRGGRAGGVAVIYAAFPPHIREAPRLLHRLRRVVVTLDRRLSHLYVLIFQLVDEHSDRVEAVVGRRVAPCHFACCTLLLLLLLLSALARLRFAHTPRTSLFPSTYLALALSRSLFASVCVCTCVFGHRVRRRWLICFAFSFRTTCACSRVPIARSEENCCRPRWLSAARTCVEQVLSVSSLNQ